MARRIDKHFSDVAFKHAPFRRTEFSGDGGGMRVLANASSPASVSETRRWSERLAVHAVIWRRAIDWIILNVPTSLHPTLIFISALFFFFKAAPARRAVVQNLKAVLPSSSPFVNQLRAFRTFYNFGWMLTDAAVHRLLRSRFDPPSGRYYWPM